MKTYISIVVALIFFQNSFGQMKKYSSDQIKEDLDYMYTTLQEVHYNLFVNTPQNEYLKAYNQLRKSINDSLDLMNAYRLLQPFVALSELGHCSVEYPFERLYEPYIDNGGKLFPLNIKIENNKAFITGNYSKNDSILKGSELLSINEIPIQGIITDIYSYLSGESEYLKNTLLDILSFPRMMWILEEIHSNYSVVIKDKNGTIVTCSIFSIYAEDFEKKFSNEAQLFQTDRTFNMIDSIAYIRPGTFMNANANGNISDVNSLENSEFVHFIDSAFTEIRKRNCDDLILDLRNNAGGSNTFSDEMLAYFADKPFKFCSKFEVKTSQITKDFWVQIVDSNLIGLKNQILNHKNGEVFISEIPYHEIKPDSDRFHGNVYVLVNRYSYSQATLTAAMIQDYGFGVLIGETTSDMPTSYASVHQFKLPNTKIAIIYPKAFIVRPNGDESSHGTIPDYMVNEDIFTKEDETLEYTLNLIRKGDFKKLTP